MSGTDKPRKPLKDARPPIAGFTSGAELRRWYWRKDELTAEAKRRGLKTTGGKFQILDRIAHHLDTGERTLPGDAAPKAKSRFDWHSAPLGDETVITDSYRNSQNVRRYFKSRLGEGFAFNTDFMAWMKANEGKTLADACEAWRALKAREKDPAFRSRIRDHNQFNQYTRDFLDDNPELGLDDVRRIWALKIQTPSDSGRHVYAREDLKLDEG